MTNTPRSIRMHRTLALVIALSAGTMSMGMAPESSKSSDTPHRINPPRLKNTPAPKNSGDRAPKELEVNTTKTQEGTTHATEHTQTPEASPQTSVAAHDGDDSHWGYSGEHGPATWSQRSDCTVGVEQSPIDIPAGMPTHNADIEFSYVPMALTLVNNGHTVQVNASRDSFIEVEDTRYDLLQFHFHALSEHTVAGKHADMEVHFVHKSAEGQYAVVGVFLNTGEHNPAFAPVFSNLPSTAGESVYAKGVAINTIDLMPTKRAYYRYDGSFTTPPCTEGVKWFVMEQAVELSREQVSSFTELYNNNFRPTQPIGARKFIAGSSSCECCKARAILSSFSGDELTE
jgi:carbonic anhydrase